MQDGNTIVQATPVSRTASLIEEYFNQTTLPEYVDFMNDMILAFLEKAMSEEGYSKEHTQHCIWLANEQTRFMANLHEIR